jgi:D-alanyl-D-alanine-carboxypeptidase/D-alanyl-D-alanine-endopeptidase
MKQTFSLIQTWCVLSFALLWFSASAAAAAPSDSEIRAILQQRIDEQHQGMGLVVGVYERGKSRVIAYGQSKKGDSRPLDGDTVFEIGSVTKVFTALVLADMVKRGEVKLDDPVGQYLPASVHVPERNGRTIQLVDLATHTSGLPRLPGNFAPRDPANPYADYTEENLYTFISVYQPSANIGSRYEYSNLGFGLLGDALARRAGTDYPSLVQKRVCKPLKLASTGIDLSPRLKSRLATGHDAALDPVANWDFVAVAGAGALRSTANDMLRFLAAMLGDVRSPLSGAMTEMLLTRRPTPFNSETALGWDVLKRDGKEFIWKNGATGGYRTFVGFDKQTDTGIVVLSNAATRGGVDDIGHHLLDPAVPLRTPPPPPRERQQIALDAAALERFVGDYEFRREYGISITQADNQLYAEILGQPRAEIFPESPRDFFYKSVDAQITFETDAEGRATRLVVHQNGQNTPALRITAEQAQMAKESLRKRVQAQTAAAGTEEAVRRQIAGILAGEPRYEDMTPELAALARPQWPKVQADFAQAGPLTFVVFRNVGFNGLDVYEAKFEKRSFEVTIGLMSDGKVAALVYRPIEQP